MIVSVIARRVPGGWRVAVDEHPHIETFCRRWCNIVNVAAIAVANHYNVEPFTVTVSIRAVEQGPHDF